MKLVTLGTKEFPTQTRGSEECQKELFTEHISTQEPVTERLTKLPNNFLATLEFEDPKDFLENFKVQHNT